MRGKSINIVFKLGGFRMSENCFICDKHQGKLKTAGVTIYEDEYVYVGHIDSNGEPNI